MAAQPVKRSHGEGQPLIPQDHECDPIFCKVCAGRAAAQAALARTGSLDSTLTNLDLSSSDSESSSGAAFTRGKCFCVVLVNFLACSFTILLLFNNPKEAFGTVFTHWHPTSISLLFIFGLVIVGLEDNLHINKSAVMLVTSAVMWTTHALSQSYEQGDHHSRHGQAGDEALETQQQDEIRSVAAVVLFVLPAMVLVEVIDHFNGFGLITKAIDRMMCGSEKMLLPLMGFLVFIFCSINDNLTSTLIALKIIRHVALEDRHWRRICGGMVVVASNAGGTWSPVFDVSTVLEPATGHLWTKRKVTPEGCAKWLLLPALVSMLVPMIGMWWQATVGASRSPHLHHHGSRDGGRGRCGSAQNEESLVRKKNSMDTGASNLVFSVGAICILGVPVMKFSVGLEAYMAMLLALGVMWLVTESKLVQRPSAKSGHHGGVVEAAVRHVELAGLLFFIGMLLAVGLLRYCGLLHFFASTIVAACGQSMVALCTMLGASSALADNTVLIDEAVRSFQKVKVDDPLWQLMALSASTGGSMTSFGSLAGVALMSTEGVTFQWYLKWVTPWAALGFFAGIATYQLERLAVG